MSIVILDFTNGEVYVVEYNRELDVEEQINYLLSNMNNSVSLDNCKYMVVENTSITFYHSGVLQR